MNEVGFVLKFDLIATVAVGLMSLYLGIFIKRKFNAFYRFGVPAAVIGGIIFALLHLFIRLDIFQMPVIITAINLFK